VDEDATPWPCTLSWIKARASGHQDTLKSYDQDTVTDGRSYVKSRESPCTSTGAPPHQTPVTEDVWRHGSVPTMETELNSIRTQVCRATPGGQEGSLAQLLWKATSFCVMTLDEGSNGREQELLSAAPLSCHSKICKRRSRQHCGEKTSTP
jgi:hypothetical protein